MYRQSRTINPGRSRALALGMLLAAGCLCGTQAVRADDTKENTPAKAAKTEKTATTDTKAVSPKAEKEKKGFITGSAIPQKVTRNGRIVTSGQNVQIIDQDDIQHSGAATTSEVIRSTVIVRPGH